jgi:hypothetical protein
MGLVPIMLDNHSEQVSIPFSTYGDISLHAKTKPRISNNAKRQILSRPVFFPIEHNRTESVYYYTVDVLYLDL